MFHVLCAIMGCGVLIVADNCSNVAGCWVLTVCNERLQRIYFIVSKCFTWFRLVGVQKLFDWVLQYMQVGDCYFVSALSALCGLKRCQRLCIISDLIASGERSVK